MTIQKVEHKSPKNKGIALIMILLMLASLMAIVAISAYVLSRESDNDWRYILTMQRMREVKRALFGRVDGGSGITGYGGFISDYGEALDWSFTTSSLLTKPDLSASWNYQTNDCYFWAGYRGDRYLEANARDANGETFFDGWGHPVEVGFKGDSVKIISRGLDGVEDSTPTPGAGSGYEKDIVENYYWKRPLNVKLSLIMSIPTPISTPTGTLPTPTITPTGPTPTPTGPTPTATPTIKAVVIYPEEGVLVIATPNETSTPTSTPTASTPTPGTPTPGVPTKTFYFRTPIPVGLRKINFIRGDDLATRMICIPPAPAPITGTPPPAPVYSTEMEISL